MTAFSFTPTSIDTSSADQTVTFSATVTDDLSGNVGGYVEFASPSGQYVSALLNDAERVSGTPLDADLSDTMTVPHFAEQGTWTAQSLFLIDRAGNTRSLDGAKFAALGFPTTFTNGP